MAKLKRKKVGSFLKSKDDSKPPYLKLSEAVPSGTIVRVESKKYQLASLDRAEAAGKLGGEILEKMRANAEKIPDFVLGDLVVLTEE